MFDDFCFLFWRHSRENLDLAGDFRLEKTGAEERAFYRHDAIFIPVMEVVEQRIHYLYLLVENSKTICDGNGSNLEADWVDEVLCFTDQHALSRQDYP